MMQIRKRVTLGILAATLVATIALGHFYGLKARNDLIAAIETSNANYARLLVEANRKNIDTLLALSNLQPAGLDSSAYKALHSALQSQVTELKIVKLKIFNLDGNTIYSTDPEQVHTTRHSSQGFQAAMQGNIFSELTFKNSIYSFNGEVFDRDIMSTYLPIYSDPATIGNALEIYTDVSDMVTEIRQNQMVFYFAAGLVSVLMVTMFIFGSRVITDEENRVRTRREYLDQQTGLPNITLFKDRLDHALRVAKRKNNMLAVLAITLPRMKKLVTNLDESDTESLFIRVSNRLLKCLRDSDTISRQENGDFVVSLDTIADIEASQKVAQRMIQSMTRPFHINNRDVYLLPNIGIAVFPMDGMDNTSLIKTAYTAMHKAQESGKAQYRFYTQEMSEQIDRQIEIEGQLLSALDKDQFILHYQPLMDILNKKEFGVEALLRWNHPDMGMISPMDFIPMLEETGLIVPVGNWVLQTACARIAELQKIAPDLTVHVNLSAKQFHQPNLLDIVRDTLKETGLKPHTLDLEITESVLIEDVDNVIRTLHELNRIGVNCSIDDFGTGYSSLSYLKRLPIQTLKIDRSFIKDLVAGNDDAAIVEAIHALSGSLRLRVIAEGVETENQQNFLAGLGIRYVQGFLYSKPLNEENLRAFLLDANRGAAMKYLTTSS